MNGDFLLDTGNALDEMRLIVEGAVVLFEEDALPLNRLAEEQEEWIALTAFNTIGEALYILRQHIRKLHEVHSREVTRQLAENNEA